ncbi:response regulator transcription factor [Desulfosporosinus sp. PR]|uniref:response regulator transcription factor n=1 Tax=Candidatus Desulfosporosinus nitrosoreducens TaxID=3401928 RepID=UPI0027FF199B|nr:response regulator transcription factor [Desulfosporosinus sp. PR]MDQ7095630.1 response regulator transcription factor [Desulfosporosinus sp. PR]
MRLLLIEDEERLAEALAFILKKQNYGIDVAYDGNTGQGLAESGAYDLIILDRMLPGKEGITLLKELRGQRITTPVLMLTAKDSIHDRVQGLDAGADDYLIKPFATEELLARVRALARRPSQLVEVENLRVGRLCLDPQLCEANIDGEVIKLTLKESQLLELLIRNAGKVITKEQILDRVWGLDADVEFGNVEIYIHYLRKKLGFQGIKIETIRGIGYCLREID